MGGGKIDSVDHSILVWGGNKITTLEKELCFSSYQLCTRCDSSKPGAQCLR